MSDDPFDQHLREELHASLDHTRPSPMLQERTQQKLGRGRRRTPPPRTLLVVAGAVAALLVAVVGAGALSGGSGRKTKLATRVPAASTTEAPVVVPATEVAPPTTAAPGAANVSPTTTLRRSTTTTSRQTTTSTAPPPTLPAYNPPQSADSRGPSSDEGCVALVLTVATDHKYYLRGSPIAVTVTVSNPSNSPCSQACPPSFWLDAHVGAKDPQNQTGVAPFEGKGAFGCGGAIAAHGTFSVHYTWCQVMGQYSQPDNTCPYNAQQADAPSGTYQVQSVTDFTTEGDQMAGPIEIIIE